MRARTDRLRNAQGSAERLPDGRRGHLRRRRRRLHAGGPGDHKLKKANERLDRIELVETVDILAELSRQKGDRLVIGFAAETDNVVEYAERKLTRKGCDAIIANDVSRADSGFGTDTNKAWIVSIAGTQELPVLTKPQLADTILDLLQNL